MVPASTGTGKAAFSLGALPCPVIRNPWSPDFGLILIRLRCRPEQSLETSTSTRNQLHERGEPLRAWNSLGSTSLGTRWPGQWAEQPRPQLRVVAGPLWPLERPLGCSGQCCWLSWEPGQILGRGSMVWGSTERCGPWRLEAWPQWPPAQLLSACLAVPRPAGA